MKITEGLGGGARKDLFLIKKMFQSASNETQCVKVKLASLFAGAYVSFNVAAGKTEGASFQPRAKHCNLQEAKTTSSNKRNKFPLS